jgi:hypothetical protein
MITKNDGTTWIKRLGGTVSYMGTIVALNIEYSKVGEKVTIAAPRAQNFVNELHGQALLTAGSTPTLHHIQQEHRPIVDPTKGVYAFDDLIVLKGAKMPAALLECGVIVKRVDEQQLNTFRLMAFLCLVALRRRARNFHR